MNLDLPFFPVAPLAFAYFLALATVHIGFGIAVARDAVALAQRGTGPLLVGPFLWTLAVVVGGVFVAGLYWAVNHSALSRRQEL